MLVFVRFCVCIGCVLDLEEVRLGEVDAPSGKNAGVFFLIGLPSNEVNVVPLAWVLLYERLRL